MNEKETYLKTIDYLFSRLPMYQRKGKAAYKADLNNTWQLMDSLNYPYRNFKSIHVAGTNGKGSVSHMLASVFQEAGYKVGLYTSPHLKDFRERIKINGKMISQKEVIDFVNTYQTQFEKIGLSFFEWTVGLAFNYFHQQKVDIAIIETGLGGRLDSTNVIKPLVSVITNIGFDHTQFLGNTLPEIAAEKAGIIKENTPVVIGETQPETEFVFIEKAKEQNAEILFADKQTYHQLPESDLMGDYQKKNIKTVLATINTLLKHYPEFNISFNETTNGIAKAAKNTGLKGRWQVLDEQPFVVADTAHNKEGLTYTIRQFLSQKAENYFFVLGFVNDKEVENIISLFPESATYIFTQPNIPRALNLDDLKPKVKNKFKKIYFKENVQEALDFAKNIANQQDAVYVGGSTFVVAEIV